MKKRHLLLVPILASLLAGCGVELNFNKGQDLTIAHNKGALGDFNLISPAANAICHDLPTFTWSESANAVTYTLEVCSENTFDATSSSVIYAKETNISATSFKLTSNLRKKNISYYWRVTAVNEYNSKTVGKEKVSAVSTFMYEVESSDEIVIGVGEKGDWALHEVGSYADISIDHNDFFGTGDQDSLVISFEKENTSQGPGHEKSDGWIVVQKAMEMDLFDLDAFYCNFYFMGHDSTILIRIIDQDGELWYKQVKFTMDTRQLALLRFDEFTLRTGDTVVQNEEFNHEHIQAIEVCFEKTFGDGCCIVGGIKAVNFTDYSHLFVKKLSYDIVPLDEWTPEPKGYDFKKTISEDKTELTLEYSTTAGFNGNEKGMNNVGWGFARIPLERYFSDGNAIRVKVKFTGHQAKANAIIRIDEPDKDRWSYEHPYAVLTEGEYQEITIPFMAFGQSSIVEGKRQFYYISKLQLGLNNCYGNGTLTYKDFEIIELENVSKHPRLVENDGLIENFDQYIYRGEAYQQWETSVSNKDEGIFLAKEERFQNGSNVYAGKFTYKADMEMAAYDIYLDVKAKDMNAVKFWIKDKSVPSGSYKGNVSAKTAIQVVHNDGRWYRYTIEHTPNVWTEYVIPFSAFTLVSGREYEISEPVISQNIINFAVGFQYFYPSPTYSQNNPVFMDEIRFTSSESNTPVVTPIENELHPEGTQKITTIDTFEYASTAALNLKWFGIREYEYENITLSDDVSSEGGEHSMQLDYVKGKDSPAYATYPCVGSDVECKAIQLDLKGDSVATIYINLYLYGTNNTLLQYRATLQTFDNTWQRVTLGLGTSVFAAQNGGAPLIRTSLRQLQKITFGCAGGGGYTTSSIYVDNMKLVLNNPSTGEEYNFGDKFITPIV